ncbi:MAG: hypothetical protein IPO18_18255 [bacterium]|nr:hypothetical protein [bacterium]
MTILLRDDFRGDRRTGRALGPARGDDPARDGRDVEGVISVDSGALRIAPPLHAGWGRTCLSYGPFPNEPGLAFSVLLLNGHNTSQSEVMADTLRSRLQRWAHGSGAAPVGRRLRRWLASGRVGRTVRQVRWWKLIAAGSTRVNLMDENLAVGLYPTPAGDPVREGAGFVMHADGPRNGELRTGADGCWAPAVLGMQNVPVCYVAVVRTDDVLLGAASLPGAHGLGALPAFRPLALVPRPAAANLHAGLQQAVLGQIGFRADTRVHGVRVASLPELGMQAAGALVADRGLSGTELSGRQAPVGGAWIRETGLWRLATPAAAGLLRVRLAPAELAADGVTLAWRTVGGDARWELRLTAGGARLVIVERGARRELATAIWATAPDDVQVLDDGREVSVLAAGGLVFGQRFPAALPVLDAAAPGLGLVLEGTKAPRGLLALEAYPRELPLPAELVAGQPWNPAAGETVAADPLAGIDGDLAGRTLPVGGRTWSRLRGQGVLAGGGAGSAAVQWRASPAAPLPDRTIYAIDWDDPGYAELEVTLTPPGSARGQREHGTAGFCLWQDEDHCLLVNTWLDDCYGGASLSSFFTIAGFEDLYDAIWTNVGGRITWGRPLRMKLVSDGLRYTVSLDGEPVLHRSLSDVYPGCRPLRITRVGLLGNWEWGADTGSRFADFRAAARPAGGLGGPGATRG